MKKLRMVSVIMVLALACANVGALAVTPADIEAQFELPYDRALYALRFPDNKELLEYARVNLAAIDGTYKFSDSLNAYAQALWHISEGEYEIAYEYLDILRVRKDIDGFYEYLSAESLIGVDGLIDYTQAKLYESRYMFKEADELYMKITVLDAVACMINMRRETYARAYAEASELELNADYSGAYAIFEQLARVEYKDSA